MKKYSWLICLFAASCTPEDSPESIPPPPSEPVEEWTSFTILPGEHNCEESTFIVATSDTLSFKAILDSSAIYLTQDSINQLDWNKLFGFSDCSSFHQTNSFRLGWRWTPQTGIEIGAYYYVESQRLFETIKVVQPKDTLDLNIAKADSTYEVSVNGIHKSYPRGCSGIQPNAYYLFPYFGGDETAPDTVSILMLFETPKDLFP